MPRFFVIDFDMWLKPKTAPIVDNLAHIICVHGTVTEQILVIPDTPVQEWGVIFEALIPATGVFGLDGVNRDN